VLGIRRGTGFGSRNDYTLSWTQYGTPLAAENRPHVLFDQLFRDSTPEEIEEERRAGYRAVSILDTVNRSGQWLNQYLGKNDREKMEEYFTSIRTVEKQLENDFLWMKVPRPEVNPIDFGEDTQALDPQAAGRKFNYRDYQRLMFDVITLALQTDSTRVVSYMPRIDLSDGTGGFRAEGNPYGYHEMTHHGEDADKLKWLTKADTWYMEEWAYFLEKLKGVKEGDGTLLDHTLLVWGSSGGTHNAHNNTMLPAMLFGGQKLGIQHQGHLDQQNKLYGSLWETMFGAMGAPVPAGFQGGASDGAFRELLPG